MYLLADWVFEAGMVSSGARELKNLLGTLSYSAGGAQQAGNLGPPF